MNKLLLLISILPVVAFADLVKPFTTDGCTKFFEGTIQNPTKWLECCVEHDLYYWAGGLHSNIKVADKRLEKCVIQKGAKIIGNLMYIGVKFGHYSPIKMGKDMAWGNAWKKRPQDALTIQEIQLLEQALSSNKMEDALKTKFICNLYKDNVPVDYLNVISEYAAICP